MSVPVCVREIKATLRLCDISLWYHGEFKFTEKDIEGEEEEKMIKASWRENGEQEEEREIRSEWESGKKSK